MKRVKITSHRAHESGFFEDMLYIHSQICCSPDFDVSGKRQDDILMGSLLHVGSSRGCTGKHVRYLRR